MKIGDSVISGELRSRLSNVRTAENGGYECDVTFDPAFRGFDGHFPGHPIVPGVCMVELVRVFAETALGRPLRSTELAQCRFRRPIAAGDEVKCKLRVLEECDSSCVCGAELKTADGGTAGQMRMRLEYL